MHCRIIDEQSVSFFSMLTKTLTVIRRQHEESIFPHSPGTQRIDKGPNTLINMGDLAIVRTIFIFCRPRLGRGIAGMGIIEVEPGKKFLVLVLFKPGERRRHYLITASFSVHEHFTTTALRKVIIIHVEALREAIAPL